LPVALLAGYTIHTVVALAHAGLIPLEHQAAVQQAFQQSAPLLNTTPEVFTALVDKSLPTMIGLGGEPHSSSLLLPASSLLLLLPLVWQPAPALTTTTEVFAALAGKSLATAIWSGCESNSSSSVLSFSSLGQPGLNTMLEMLTAVAGKSLITRR